jgi:hypothetical protein
MIAPWVIIVFLMGIAFIIIILKEVFGVGNPYPKGEK